MIDLKKYGKAIEIAARTGYPQVVKLIAQTTVEMCEGEVLEMELLGNPRAISEEACLKIIRKKTASLTRVAAKSGAITGEASEDVVESISNYGELMGINKDEARRRWGAEQVHLWQRSYDIAPPGGESLKVTAQRVVPFFEKRIAPELRAGKNVIVVAHGNSLRALIMQLDRLLPEDVERVELRTGHPLIYRLNADGSIAEKRDIAA